MDRLAEGQPADPAHPGLDRLLAAATAPAYAEELAGERAAVAEFAQAHQAAQAQQGAVTTRTRVRGTRVLPFATRTALVKFGAGVAVLLVGGTAFAGESGHLPAGAQQRVHDALPFLGMPAPRTGAEPGGTASPGPHSASASRTPTPKATDLVGLCRAWTETHKDQRTPDMPADGLRALITAAGDESAINPFCAKLLADANGASPSADGSASGQPTPSHPGNSPHPHPTPKH